MKRHITFPSTRTIFKLQYWLLILCLSSLFIGIFLYPYGPTELTIFDNKKNIYSEKCPIKSQLKPYGDKKKKQLNLPFTLLNWNIYKQQRKQWQKQLQHWSKKADLLTLQEVKYTPQFERLNEINELNSFQNYAFKYQEFIYGVNTLSKYSSQFVCGTRYIEPWSRIAKTGLATTYSLSHSSEPLLLINLHGINFTFTSQPLIDQITPYIALIKTHQGPVIFSGDFNTWSQSRLDRIHSVLLKTGLKEVTFDNDQRIRFFDRPLDHIYFRGLKVIKAESLATEASDHTPLIVTFDRIDFNARSE